MRVRYPKNSCQFTWSKPMKANGKPMSWKTRSTDYSSDLKANGPGELKEREQLPVSLSLCPCPLQTGYALHTVGRTNCFIPFTSPNALEFTSMDIPRKMFNQMSGHALF